MIPNDVITQLNNIPIDQVFAHYGHQVGREGVYQCPFHEDKSPSMQIKADTNTFYCHACFAGSSAHDSIKTPSTISVVMGFERLSFPEASKVLADRHGIALEVHERTQEADPYVLQLPDAIHRFHQALLQSEQALAYLHARGITMRDIEFWRLGLGTDTEGMFSYLNNRLTFPLSDAYGSPVSITGRLILNADEMSQLKAICKEQGRSVPPKYVDRKPYRGKAFVKNNYLYGLHQASAAIRQTKIAYVTEGWTDIISAHRSGLHHSVSSMGLGLSERQLKMLRSAGAETLIFLRDGDLSGQKAMIRDISRSKEMGFHVEVCALDEGMDLDELCVSLQNDPFRLYQHLEERRIAWHLFEPHLMYKMNQKQIMNHSNEIARIQTKQLEDVRRAITKIEDLALRHQAVEHAALWLRMSPEMVLPNPYHNPEGKDSTCTAYIQK